MSASSSSKWSRVTRRMSIGVHVVLLSGLLYLIWGQLGDFRERYASDDAVAVGEVVELGGRVHYKYRDNDGKITEQSEPPNTLTNRPVIERVVSVYFPNPKTDGGLDLRIGHKFDIDELDDLDISDEQLKNVLGFKHLQTLVLVSNEITDASIKRVSKLNKIRTLVLSGEKITDRGIRHLKDLRRLDYLSLTNTKVTDQGLHNLARLKSLRWLDLSETGVSPEGVRWLRRKLPACTVYFRDAIAGPLAGS